MAEKTPDDIDAVIERECREWMASPTHEPMDYRVPGLLRQIDRLAAQLSEARKLLIESFELLTGYTGGFVPAGLRAFLAATEPKP